MIITNFVAFDILTTDPSDFADLIIERKLLQIHPTVKGQGHSVGVGNVAVWLDLDEDVFAIQAHQRGFSKSSFVFMEISFKCLYLAYRSFFTIKCGTHILFLKGSCPCMLPLLGENVSYFNLPSLYPSCTKIYDFICCKKCKIFYSNINSMFTSIK